MMYFTIEEIGRSILIALSYGALFGILIGIIAVIIGTIKDFLYSIKQIIVYEKLTNCVKFQEIETKEKGSATGAFVSVVLFFLGFMLISYMSLDGCIRIYMLILSSASFFVVKSTIVVKMSRLSKAIFRHLISLIIISLRVTCYPFHIIFKRKSKI